MESNLLTWKEKLSSLALHDTIELDDDQNDQSIYSAIKDNPALFKDCLFSIRTDRTTKTPTYKGKRFVMRIK